VGVIPFETLGFDETRSRDLRSENLSDTVEPNNDFYFPAILREKPLPASAMLKLEARGESDAQPQDGQPATAGEEEDLNWWEQREREKKRRRH